MRDRQPEKSDARPSVAELRFLYLEHSRSLLAYATRLTGDRFAAEDVVQETLLRAWRNPDSVRDAGTAVRAWLFTVARNLVIDRARHISSRPKEVAESSVNQASVDDHAPSVIEGMVIHQAIAALSPIHREILVEIYYRDRTVSDAAHVLDIPEGTVRSRIFYAMRALRGLLVDTDGTTAGVAR